MPSLELVSCTGKPMVSVEEGIVDGPVSTSLNGKRLGLLDNSKLNADNFLAQLTELVAAEFDLKSVITVRKKSAFGGPLEEDELQLFKENSDVVINAFGD